MSTTPQQQFAHLLGLAQTGNLEAVIALQDEKWQPHIDEYKMRMPQNLLSLTTFKGALAHYLRITTLRVGIVWQLNAMKDILFIVEKLFSPADQAQFETEFDQSIEAIRAKLRATFTVMWQHLTSRVRHNAAARDELATLFQLAHSPAYLQFKLPTPTAQEHNAWLVRTVKWYHLRPQQFVGSYLPQVTANNKAALGQQAISSDDSTLAVWICCCLVAMGQPPPSSLETFAVRACQ